MQQVVLLQETILFLSEDKRIGPMKLNTTEIGTLSQTSTLMTYTIIF